MWEKQQQKEKNEWNRNVWGGRNNLDGLRFCDCCSYCLNGNYPVFGSEENDDQTKSNLWAIYTEFVAS